MSSFLVWVGGLSSETIPSGTQSGPICNSESEVSGDQVALLNSSHPICTIFGLVEAESLGSQQTRPSGTRGKLFGALCLTVVFVGLVCSVFVSLLTTDLT